MGALKKYGEWIRNAAERQGLLRHGMGEGRLNRILASRPGTRISSYDPETTTLFSPSRMNPGEELSVYMRNGRAGDVRTPNEISNMATDYGAHRYAQYSGIDPDTPAAIAHMLGAGKGEGLSDVAYPAFAEIQADKGGLIFPDWMVTRDNVPNRSLKAVGADLNHKKPVIIPADSQLSGSVLNVDDYMGMNQDERAAFMFMMGQNKNDYNLLEELRRAKYNTEAPQTFRKAEDALGLKLNADVREGRTHNALGMLSGPGDLSLSDMAQVAELLRKLGVQNIGVDTLRRSSANQFMSSGKQAPDDLIKDLLFKDGGQVKTTPT